MSWAKLLASNRVTQQPSAKAELDSLRSIVARCFSDVTAKGLSTDARFIMAYDAARTLSVMIVRARARRANDKLRCTSRASRSCGAPFAGIIGLRCHFHRPLLRF